MVRSEEGHKDSEEVVTGRMWAMAFFQSSQEILICVFVFERIEDRVDGDRQR